MDTGGDCLHVVDADHHLPPRRVALGEVGVDEGMRCGASRGKRHPLNRYGCRRETAVAVRASTSSTAR
ncbi:hypothetical protein [Streptomyces caniscabiei]|uniref:hypothetical protein n=1 Tax=Streptomyces caniscabiei TaxID=2746961 RepID=UPI001780918A|nr:hypothetical protein [Streptomyces caniscabiei]MDX3732337.1 hypothetical protein [Streptomyces caniscabiei]